MFLINKDTLAVVIPIALIVVLGLFITNIDSIFPTNSASAKLNDIKLLVNSTGSDEGTNPNATVTIIEFSDFQCPACAQVAPEVKKVLDYYGDKVNFVFKHFAAKQGSDKAAEAAECARDQGKFWEYHDILFGNLHSVSVSDLERFATQLGLDEIRFSDCLINKEKENKVSRDFMDGMSVGLKGTPSFIINGQMIVGGRSFEEFKQIIDKELK